MTINQFFVLADEVKNVLYGKKRRRHFDLCSDELILFFVSIAYNAAKGNLSLTEQEQKRLASKKKFILELGYCNSTIAKKRQLLNKNCKQSLSTIKALRLIALERIKDRRLK